MTLHDGFDRTVSDWLDGEAGHGMPGYLDEILIETTGTRQRPWWSSLERWLPMQSTTRFAQVPRMVWVLIVMALVIALATAVLVVGSRRSAPAPLAPVGHGTVLYAAADGDIYALDTATDKVRPLIVGPGADSGPSVSPDGTKVAFARRVQQSDDVATMIAGVDGSNPVALAGISARPEFMVWSPKSDQLAVVGVVNDTQGLWVMGLHGPNTLVQVQPAAGGANEIIDDPQWRPNGHEIVFLGSAYGTVPTVAGFYIVRSDGTGLRLIAPPIVDGPTRFSLSPDGSKVAYAVGAANQGEIHVMDVDSGADRAVAFDGTAADLRPHWSPDGTKLVFERYSGGTFQLMIGAATGGPLTGIGPTRPDKTGGAEVQFSPDGASIVAFYNADKTSWLLDPAGGPGTKLEYDAVSPPAWQPPTS
jgi:dipeptidyl aminopeptidase/acylaminoacyl peptidase